MKYSHTTKRLSHQLSLSVVQELSLIMQAQDGEQQALFELVERYKPLVFSIVRHYPVSGSTVISKEDVVQDGIIGFMEAVKRYNPEKGASLGTYATWWIHAAIQKSVWSVGDVRVPERYQKLARRIRITIERIQVRNGQLPSVMELKEEFRLTDDQAREMQDIVGIQIVRLNAPAAPDKSEGELGASFADPQALSPEVVTLARCTKRELEEVLDQVHDYLHADPTINKRARTIFLERACLNGSLHQTLLEDLARRFGVTKERVRQIEARVGEKLTEQDLPGTIKEIEEIRERISILAEV